MRLGTSRVKAASGPDRRVVCGPSESLSGEETCSRLLIPSIWGVGASARGSSPGQLRKAGAPPSRRWIGEPLSAVKPEAARHERQAEGREHGPATEQDRLVAAVGEEASSAVDGQRQHDVGWAQRAGEAPPPGSLAPRLSRKVAAARYSKKTPPAADMPRSKPPGGEPSARETGR
jgi:hypothetical protein